MLSIPTNQSQLKLFHAEHCQTVQVELPAECNSWSILVVTSVGRELLKLFQNSPLSLDGHDTDLQELMMSAALRSKFSNSKPNITELNVSMNEDKSCTVESCVRFINANDCTVVSHAFSITSSLDTTPRYYTH